MRKRASLARAMALDPEVLFLDEPTSGLDPISSDAIDELVLELKNSLGLTIVTVTHDMDSLWRIADRVALFANGRVAVEGTMDELSRFDERGRATVFRRPSRTRQRTRGGATVTTKNTYIRIGVFVVALTTALIWGTLWLSAGGAPGEYDFYYTYMNESVSGLSPDAALTYRGVNVGKVREIMIDPNNPESGAADAAGEARRADQAGHRGDARDAGSDRPRDHRPARRFAAIRRR